MDARMARVISVVPGAGGSERYATALERAGFSVETTAEPAACIERIAAGADCVVSPYRLDGIDGIELLREVRERYPDLPFVLVASDGDEAVASEAVAAGVTEYVPVDGSVPSDLADRVEGAIERASHAGGRCQWELHDVYERISDAFCAVDEAFRLTYVNERAEELLGADRETLLGECLWEAFPEAGGTSVYDALHEAVETGQATESELYYGPLDIWLDARIYPSETGLSVYLRDVTDRVEREQVLREAYEIVSVPDRSFAEQVGALLELGCEVLGTDYATLSSVRDGEYVFERIVAPAGTDLQSGDAMPLEATVCERVVKTERTLVLRDIEVDAPDLVERARSAEGVFSSYIGAPVSVDGEVTGTFCFYDEEPRSEPFSDWEETFVDLLTNWVSRQIEREQYADRLAGLDTAFPDLGFCLDADGRYLDCLAGAAASELLSADPEVFLGRTLHEILPAETADLLLETIHEAIETGELRTVEYELEVPAGDRWFEARVAPLTDGKYGPDTVILVARDVTERKEHERDLERQRDELTHLHRINTLVRGITRALQDAATRDAIETAVCEHLTESNLYRTAWIGTRERDVAGEVTVVPQTTAGVDEDDIPGTDGAAERAIRSGDVQVVDRFADASARTGGGHALAAGNRSLAVVPLATGETTYGVLVVCAPRDQPISEAEREVLADLGRTIALAIQRVYSQRSLAARTALELQLRMPDTDLSIAEVTTRLNCELTFERQVPVGGNGCLQYFTVEGADPSAVCERLLDSPAVDRCVVVREGTDRPGLIEVRIGDGAGSVIDVLISYGASITTAHAVDGEVNVTAEVAPEADVRDLLEDLEEVASTVDLVSKRLIDRPVPTVPAVEQLVRNELTTKQEAALATAYTRGYYAWPRGSTAEEIAQTMDIASSTLHYHLRHALQNLLTAFFEPDRLGR